MVVFSHHYDPLPGQEQAHATRARHVLYGGGVGAGKSRFLVEHAFSLMTRWPGIPLLLARQDLLDLQRTTEEVWKRVIDNRLWDKRYGGRHNTGDNWYRFPNGSTLYLTGLKDWESWLSAELGGILIEEVSEVSEDAYRGLETRLRWTTGEGECERPECRELETYRQHHTHPFYQMVSASNPTPRWPKRRWVDPFLAGEELPNHAYIPAKTKENTHLPPGYEHDLRLSNKYNPAWVERMLEGDWTAMEGAAYPHFSRGSHMWRRGIPFTHLIDKVYGGIDWGALTTYAHPQVGLLVAVLRDETHLCFAEYSKQGPASADFFEWMEKMQKAWHVEKWWADPTQPKAIELLKPKFPIDGADRVQGSRGDREMNLSNQFGFNPVRKRPFLMIHEDCTHTLTGIETHHEVPESEATRGNSAITKEMVRRDDDEVDALGYVEIGIKQVRPAITNHEVTITATGTGSAGRDVSAIMAMRRADRHERLATLVRRFEEEDARAGEVSDEVEQWLKGGR